MKIKQAPVRAEICESTLHAEIVHWTFETEPFSKLSPRADVIAGKEVISSKTS